MRIPFLAQALRSGGHVLIDRAKHGDAMAALERAAVQVRAGKTVLIFPEGTRGDSDTVGIFKKGGFHLARAAQVPILPVGLRGSRSVFPRGSLLPRPGRIEVHIGPEIPVTEVARYELGEMLPRQLKETTMDRSVRTLLRVELAEDDKKTSKLVDQLMGNKPEARFRFIQERAEFAKPDALDI